jgi:transcriptional regulator with XRE-family HTH domain
MAKRPNPARVDSNAAIGERLRLIRIAYGRVQGHSKEMSQLDIATLVGMTKQSWNNAETGDNRIGLDAAMRLCVRTGVTLDYVYRGDQRNVAHSIAVAIAEIEKPKSSARSA